MITNKAVGTRPPIDREAFFVVDIILTRPGRRMYNPLGGTAVHKQHGTAFSFGQLMELGSALLRALPKALKSVRGVNPKELLKVINHNGELLELGLGELLSSMMRRGHPQGATTTSNAEEGHRSSSRKLIIVNVPIEHTPAPPFPTESRLKSDVVEPTGSVAIGLYNFLKLSESGTQIKGDIMVVRSRKRGKLLGERHARALLAQQHVIPESWEKHVLVFPGTIWTCKMFHQRSNCFRYQDYVYTLLRQDGLWILGECELEPQNWGDKYRVVVPVDTAA